MVYPSFTNVVFGRAMDVGLLLACVRFGSVTSFSSFALFFRVVWLVFVYKYVGGGGGGAETRKINREQIDVSRDKSKSFLSWASILNHSA